MHKKRERESPVVIRNDRERERAMGVQRNEGLDELIVFVWRWNLKKKERKIVGFEKFIRGISAENCGAIFELKAYPFFHFPRTWTLQLQKLRLPRSGSPFFELFFFLSFETVNGTPTNLCRASEFSLKCSLNQLM